MRHVREWRSGGWAGLIAVACAAGVGSLGGCAAKARPAEAAAMNERVAAEPPETAAVPPTQDNGARLPITGFDIARSREAWSIGDRVLLQLRLQKGETRTMRYLLIELSNEQLEDLITITSTDIRRKKYTLASPIVHTRITLLDERGQPLEASAATGRFPRVMLLSGLYDGVHPMIPDASGVVRTVEELTDAEASSATRGWMSLVAFSGSMNRRGVFKSMLEEVIRKPSLLSLLFNRSVSIGTGDGQAPTREAAWVAPGSTGPGLGSIRMPLYMDIAGTRALEGEIVCVEPVAPLALCGGLVRAKGTRPGDPGTTIEIELVAAARGAGGQTCVEIRN